jgi:dihydrofolate reductase
MRKLVLKMSISVDGFVGGEKGSMDWAFRSMDRATAPWIAETLGQAGLHIMGSRTFQDMVAWWPTSTEIFAPPMNEIPKAVFSRSGKLGSSTQALRDAARMRADTNGPSRPLPTPGRKRKVIGGELAAGIKRFKKQGGKFILAHGGASFAQSLVATGLIDEYRLVVHPCVLGTGLPLFAKIAAPLDLALVEAKTFPGGAAAQIYRPI